MHVEVGARHDGLSVEHGAAAAHSRIMLSRHGTTSTFDAVAALDTAYRQAQLGLSEGGIPVSYTHLTLPTNREV